MKTATQKYVAINSTDWLSLGPFPPGTLLRAVTIFAPFGTGTYSVQLGLCSAVPRAAVDFAAGQLLTDALSVGASMPLDNVQTAPAVIPVNGEIGSFRMVVAQVVTDGGFAPTLAIAADVHEPAPLPLDDVPLPPPPVALPPSKSPRKLQPRSEQQGKGDDVFKRMVREALAEFFAGGGGSPV